MFSLSARIHHASLPEALSSSASGTPHPCLFGCSCSRFFTNSVLSSPLRGASSDPCWACWPVCAPSSRMGPSPPTTVLLFTNSAPMTLMWGHPVLPVVLSSGHLPRGHLLCHVPHSFHPHIWWILPLKSLSSPPLLCLSWAATVALSEWVSTQQVGCCKYRPDHLTHPPFYINPSESCLDPFLGPWTLFSAPSLPAPVPVLWLWPHGPAGSFLDVSHSFLYWGHSASSHGLLPSPGWLLLPVGVA